VWILIPEGFFSIVQAEGEDELCVRARDPADLDRLRERYLPALGETVETRGSDYRYRARAPREALADALAAIARSMSYPSFTGEIARCDPRRLAVYQGIWALLADLQLGGPFS
jgi:hypothetical protein